jgi:hypothetical protein
MTPVFWKLSMGPGSVGGGFDNLLPILDWIRQGVVLVHKNTAGKGGHAKTTQGADFMASERDGEYFYLCHGNKNPGVLLLGQFVGPANLFSAKGHGWADRSFRWIKTSVSTKRYKAEHKRWTPRDHSTFVKVPEDELTMFEAAILKPYFKMSLAHFSIDV